MSKRAPRQYTIRGVAPHVDQALRRAAQASGRSINEVALEALARGLGEPARPSRDLSFIAGSMAPAEALRVEAELAIQRRVDPKLW